MIRAIGRRVPRHDESHALLGCLLFGLGEVKTVASKAVSKVNVAQ